MGDTEINREPQGTKSYKPSLDFVITVLVIIGLVLFLPSILMNVGHGKRSQVFKAKMEMKNLEAAILQYESSYNRFPASTNAFASGTSDFTFGTFTTGASKIGVTNSSGYQANNSEVMAVLMDMTHFPDGRPTINVDHSRNPQQRAFYNAKQVSDTKSAGIGSDGVYRDPWGNPYIITIDSNSDKYCRDAFYGLASVSEKDAGASGFNDLTRPTPPPYNSQTKDSFQANITVMIWSFGPDGKADRSQKADAGVNKDNILSWR